MIKLAQGVATKCSRRVVVGQVRGAFATALALLFVSWCLPPTADALTAQAALQRLNEQRVANGIPGGVIERPDWSQGCANHNAYQASNGTFGHSEDPALPGYSPAGQDAASSSVLARGGDWSQANPWENAPIHLAQVLAPALSETGIDDSNGYTCMWTFPGYNRPAVPAALYTYPGNGRVGVPPEQKASESPFVPGDAVGLPLGTTTGPHLLVYGPWAGSPAGQVTAASLTGPSGPVEVRFVDNTNARMGNYLPKSSAILIPVSPLQPKMTYTASVALNAGVTPVQGVWSFTTGEAPVAPGSALSRKAKVSISSIKRKGRTLTLSLKVSKGEGKFKVRASERLTRVQSRKRKPGTAKGKRLADKLGLQRFKLRLPRYGKYKLSASFDGKNGWSDKKVSKTLKVKK